jgi:hypothetical protein
MVKVIEPFRRFQEAFELTRASPVIDQPFWYETLHVKLVDAQPKRTALPN